MNKTPDFDILDKLNSRYFTELEHFVPHIQQTLFDLQNEYYKTWKNTVTANASLYKEFLVTLGYKFPKESKDMVESMSEEALKLRAIYNKIAISNMEFMKNTIKAWNDNADTFVVLNHKILHYWVGAFSPK